jgi:hypothetical protein
MVYYHLSGKTIVVSSLDILPEDVVRCDYWQKEEKKEDDRQGTG